MRNSLSLAAVWLCAAVCGVLGVTPVRSLAGDPDIPNALAGRYSHHFQNGDITGRVFWSDDVVEIVRVGSDAAYIRIALNFFNGHECGIFGVGRAEGDRIVYRDPAKPLLDGDRPCVISVSRSRTELRIDDDGGSCKQYCGARGSFGGAVLPFGSRRSIAYMPILKASQQYRNAIIAWRASR